MSPCTLTYDWLMHHADDEGFVEACAIKIANDMHRSLFTVKKELNKLQKQQRIAIMSHGKYVVYELAEQAWRLEEQE